MGAPGSRRLWVGYVAVTAVLTIVSAFGSTGMSITFATGALSRIMTVGAIIAGIRIHRPDRRLPWILMASVTVTGTAGDMIFWGYKMHGAVPFPSLADLLWLAGYPIQLAGLMLLVNGLSWRRDRAGVLDTLMVTGGLGLAVWMAFLHDLIGPQMPWLTRLVTMAYPLADLLLLAGVIRMFVSSARRSPAFWQLTTGLAGQSLAHAAWIWQSLHATVSTLLVPAFVLGSLLVGASALHPSMAALGTETARPAGHATRLRVAFIGSACLLSPLLLVIDGVVHHGHVHWVAASVCCIVVFLLLIARMVGLVRTVQMQADQLEAIAYLDALTGIPNRRAWDAELERRIAVARRSGGVLVVGLLDIDHFKNYNDLLGHPAGDALLRDAATAWQQQLRAGDLIARYGGEEFGVILHCPLRDAAMVMDRLREATPDGQTFSAGLALWTGEESAGQLTARADAALYVAKRDGRDQFTVTGNPARTDLHADFLAETTV